MTWNLLHARAAAQGRRWHSRARQPALALGRRVPLRLRATPTTVSADAALRLRGLGQLLQGAAPARAPRHRVRDGRVSRRRPLEPAGAARRAATRRCACRRSCSTTGARSASRTRSSGTSARGRDFVPDGLVRARAGAPVDVLRAVRATSRTSRSRASGSRTRARPRRVRRPDPRADEGRVRARSTRWSAHLAGATFLVGERYTLADIALYAYTHVAHEGGFDLGAYPAIRAWLERVASQPGHVTIDA